MEWDQDNLAAREASLLHRELTLDAKALLDEKGLPKSLLDVLPFTNAEANQRAIEALEKLYPASITALNAADQGRKQTLIDRYNLAEQRKDVASMLSIGDQIRAVEKGKA